MALFDEEWVGEARRVLDELPVAECPDTIVQFTVTGGPDGRVVIGVTIADGALSAVEAGRAASPDCKVSLSHETACRIVDGSVDPDVAFMGGSMKVEGDHAGWLVDLREIRSAALEALRGITGDGA